MNDSTRFEKAPFEPGRGETIWGLIRAAYLVRYSLLTLLGPMAVLAWVGATQRFVPLANIFLIDSAWRFFTFQWLCALAVSISLAATRVTWLNAPDRFPDIAERFRPRRRFTVGTSIWWFVLWLVFVLALPVVCYYRTMLANGVLLDWDGTTLVEGTAGRGVLVISLGVAAAIVTIVVFGAIVRLFIGGESLVTELTPFDALTRGIYPPGILDPVSRGMATLLANYVGRPNGYVRIAHGGKFAFVLAPGHERQTIMLLLFLLMYVGIYLHPALNRPEQAPFCVLFYAVLVLLILGLVLGGLSFMFDFYRIPTLAVVLLGGLLIGSSYQADHFYELLPLEHPLPQPLGPPGSETPAVVEIAPLPAPKFSDVVDAWRRTQARAELTGDSAPQDMIPAAADGRRTLCIVCAAGGGIQSAAWTARVLTGLHERYGNPFTRSIGLISSVSGGSLGTYYYLLRYPDLVHADQPTQVREISDWIRTSATQSGLEAIGWGLAFPDLLRSLAPTSRFSPSDFVDRGLALESVWRRRVDTLDEVPETMYRQTSSSYETLLGLRDMVLAGELPLPIFNSTVCDEGQRLLFSPIRVPIEPVYTTDADEFARLYPYSDIRLTTAVRLSATFSYVTPVCRPERQGIRLTSRWVADGGYADNDGVVTAITSLLQLLSTGDARTPLPFDRVVIIRVAAFPESRLRASDFPADLDVPAESAERSASLEGWKKSIIGPLEILLSVRHSSQHERANLELKLLEVASQKWKNESAQTTGSSSMASNLKDILDTSGKRPAGRVAPIMGQRPVQIAAIKLVFDPELVPTRDGFPRRDSPALSWKMSEQEIRAIDEVWAGMISDPSKANPLRQPIFYSSEEVERPDLSIEDLFGSP